ASALFRHLARGLEVEVGDRHPRAFSGQPAADGAADATTSAGDDGQPSLKAPQAAAVLGAGRRRSMTAIATNAKTTMPSEAHWAWRSPRNSESVRKKLSRKRPAA